MFARPAFLKQITKQLGLFLVVGLSLVGQKTAAQGGLSATVAWDPSSTTNVTAYNVYYGTRSGHYTNSFTVDAFTTSAPISGLEAGTTYFIAVTAVDDLGDESGFSAETYIAVPSAPKLLTQTWSDNANNMYLEITTPLIVTRSWEVQYSLDMVNWSTYGTGYNSVVDIASWVDTVNYPQLFFRLAIY